MESIKRENALDAIDELMDKQTALAIATMRSDLELGKQIADCAMAWRELAMNIADLEYAPGEQLYRHFRSKGE